MSKKIINITAAAMALAVTLSGCATAVVQERKDQAAAAASAEAAQAAVTATPGPTAEPTPEPINAWSLLSNLPDFTPGTLDNPDTTWPDGIPMGQSPLSYDDGSKFYSLRSVDTGKTLDITDVALQDVRDLPVKGYLKLNELENGDTVIGEINAESTGEGVEKEISDFSIDNSFVLLDDYSVNLHEWKANRGSCIKLRNGINGNGGTWKGESVTRFDTAENIADRIWSIIKKQMQ